MIKLLNKFNRLMIANMNGVDIGIDEAKLIQRIKKYHHEYPFAHLGLPKEEYATLQEILKS